MVKTFSASLELRSNRGFTKTSVSLTLPEEAVSGLVWRFYFNALALPQPSSTKAERNEILDHVALLCTLDVWTSRAAVLLKIPVLTRKHAVHMLKGSCGL